MALDMSPLLATDNPADLGLTKPICGSNVAVQATSRSFSADFSNQFRRELSSAVVLARLIAAIGKPLPADSIMHVVVGRSGAKMVWVAALRIIARMQYVQTVRYFFKRQEKSQSMGTARASSPLRDAIVVAIASCPWPATGRPTAIVDALPKASGKRRQVFRMVEWQRHEVSDGVVAGRV